MTKNNKIEIRNMSSPETELYRERLASYDILEPTEWQQRVVREASFHLNAFREKYGEKGPIAENHIKLRIVGNTYDLTPIMDGKDAEYGHTGGFVDYITGEVYIAGGSDGEDVDTTLADHILIHELVHYFAGKHYSLMSWDEMEAMTDFVATEIQAKIMSGLDEAPFYVDVDGSRVDLDTEEKLLRALMDYFADSVYANEKEALVSRSDFDYERLKEALFLGPDYTHWGYQASIV